MKRSKRLLLCIIMILCVVVGNEVTVFAQDNVLAEYEAELLFDERMAEGSGQISTTSLDYTFLEIQKYFYDGNVNYLYLRANVSDKGGVAYYDSTKSMGSTMSSYPAYGCEDADVSYSRDRREAYCTWVCTKHLSKDLIATGLYTLNCTFVAEGGNVQGGIVICTPPIMEQDF